MDTVIYCRIVNKFGETESSKIVLNQKQAQKFFADAFISLRDVDYYNTEDGVEWVYYSRE